ncbi:MAG: WYL domain-containing protein [Micrococcales bacterium]|nr:WYL domain-containing protein [Micrococcales bacterium]
MRVARMMSLLWMLKSGRTLSAAEAAAELEVSPRTVLRDVETLSAAGVPVYCARGRSGGLRLAPEGRSDVLTEAEAQALLTVAAVPDEPDLTAALHKVAVPHPERGTGLLRRVLLDPGSWHDEQPPLLDALQHALLDGHRAQLLCHDRRTGGSTVRTVDPYGLVNAAGVWYLAARHRGRVRFFLVHRILDVTVIPEPVRVPASFDLALAWRQARATWRKTNPPMAADVQVRAEALARLHPGVLAGAAPPPDTTGWVRLTLSFHDARHALSTCVGMGPDLCVLAPAHLREAIVARHQAVVDLYS